MSINSDPVSPRLRNGSISSKRSAKSDHMVPLLDGESFEGSLTYSTLTSSTSSDGGGIRRPYTPDFSYISTDMTAEAIRQCEKWILTPYSNALKMIGWLPYNNRFGGVVWQGILIIIWTTCIMCTMVTQILSCFKRDAFVPGKSFDFDEIPLTNSSPSLFEAVQDITPIPISAGNKIIRCDDHLISSLILLDFVVLATYFFGIYLFSRGETDYLFGLASHVFIKNSEANSSSSRLIRTIGILYVCAIVWLAFSLSIRIMTSIAVELFQDNVLIVWPAFTLEGGVKITLLCLSLFGFFTFDMVYIFSIMNYVAQGEMNIYLLWDIRKLIEIKKYDDIDGAIKDTHKCKRYLEILNGKTATLTGLALFVLAILAITAIIELNQVDKTDAMFFDEKYRILAGVSSFFNAVCWSLLVSLPFVQAARVTYWCDQLKDMGVEIRGRVSTAYMESDLLDLDSLLSFLQASNLRASMFGIPISPWFMYLVVVTISFTMLVLFQLDDYSIAKYI